MRQWTDEQKKAIEENGCSLIVSAAAGSGKTAVLVERIIKKIIDINSKINIDNLLVVTFTNAAAAEMKERIEKSLNDILKDKNLDKKYISHVTKQINLLPISNITTIHSFCMNVVRDNLHKIDSLDSGFKVGDEAEINNILDDALEELFEEELLKEDKEKKEKFVNLIYFFDERREERCKDAIKELYIFARSFPHFEDWLTESSERLNIKDEEGLLNSIFYKHLYMEMIFEIKSHIKGLTKAEDYLSKISGFERYYMNYVMLRESLEVLCYCEDIEDLLSKIEKFSFERLPTIKGFKDEKDMVKGIRSDIKDYIESIKKKYCKNTEYILKVIRGSYDTISELTRVILRLHEIFSTKKHERNLMDFNDMEHMCFDVLISKNEDGAYEPSSEAKYYMEKFSEILIDEYQDSNRIQEEILKSIGRENSHYKTPNIFMVGDVKQSIYRFRNACPEMFIEKYKTYKEEGSHRKIKLYKNFRSLENILEAVNLVFKLIMSESLGEIEYTKEEYLTLGSDVEGLGEVEINILDYDKEYESDDEEITSIGAEARMVGKMIQDLIKKKHMIWKGDSLSEIDYRDIVILSRATESASRIFLEEFSKLSIPVFADSKTGYFESYEVKTILSLLSIIDNPYQDIPLLSVLKSPIGGFCPDEIMDIRLIDEESYIYENMLKMEDEKVKSFIEKIVSFREDSTHMRIHELIWKLCTETGFYGYVAALPYGNERRANLKLLFEKGKDFEEANFRGLFKFINFINKFKESNGDFGAAKIMGENENVVRFMSIHKSKGLEFPVVILTRCGKNINFMSLNKKLIYHGDLGIAMDYVDFEKRTLMKNIVKDIIKDRLKRETLSEEMRLLYVAMTRAKYKLMITGSVSNLEKNIVKWKGSLNFIDDKLSNSYVASSKNFLDFLMPAVFSNCHIFKFTKMSMEDIDISVPDKVEFLEERGIDPVIFNEIDRRLNFIYPHERATNLPTRVTVTELKRRWEMFESGEEFQNDIIINSPRFLNERMNIKGSEIGIVNHLFLQHLDFKKEYTYESLNEEIDIMIKKGLILKDQKMLIMVKNVMEFLSSDIIKRLKDSKKVMKEFPFQSLFYSYELFPDEVYDKKSEDKVMIQGIADIFFEEDDGIVLLDYKTERGDYEAIKSKYRRQLELYSKCIEKILNKRVKEKFIYLLSLGKILKL